MVRTTAYNALVSLTVALGSFTYGYSISILGNTLTKPIFYEYMKLTPGSSHATAIIAWWNCILYVGGFFSCFACPFVGDRYGRKTAIGVGALLAVTGSALQAGSVSPAMMIVARLVCGFGIGFLLPGVPLYQAEISPPSSRGLIVGFHAALLGVGTMTASWFGVAFFHVPGAAGWRVPLALQAVFPLVLFTLVWFLPESPRWLYMHDQAEKAEKVLIALHRSPSDPDHTFARKEIYIMKGQIDYERQHRMTIAQALKKRSMQKRFLVGFLGMSATQASGLIVVLTYQSVIYGSLGYSNFTVSIIASVWCVFNGIGNLIGGLLGDYVGRKRQMVCGLTVLACILIVLCVTTKLFAGTSNRSGNVTAAVFTFFLIIAYTTGVECAAFVLTSEVFPGEWRALGISTSMTAVFLWGCIFTAVASPAFANIGALYYVVFICLTSLMVFVVLFVFPNTKGFTLEQMAAVFGDDVVDMHGHVEHGQDFVKEDHDIEHAEIEDTALANVAVGEKV